MLAKAMRFARSLLLDWQHFPLLLAFMLLAETLLGSIIILKVPYTEIDWIAYMQEVEGWIEGSTDYMTLKGDTGPLVYPAGFLYIYRALHWLTAAGRTAAGVRLAQWVFLGVYLITLTLAALAYRAAKPGPPAMLLLLMLSKRVHSLYMLRMFNDTVTMAIMWGAILLLQRRAWLAGCILYSLSVSVKMNTLLFAPALAYLMVRNCGILRSALYGVVMIAVQAALGAPFLLTYPESYLARAFELTRVFFHKWTVNWKFLPEHMFVSKGLATSLLAAHLLVLLAMAHFSWTRRDGGLFSMMRKVLLKERANLLGDSSTTSTKSGRSGAVASTATNSSGGAYTDSPSFILHCLLTANFAGIVFSRTLHYQFYSWYWHSLPYLLCTAASALPPIVKVVILGAIEYAFNVGDAEGAGTAASSAGLQAAHFLLLTAVVSGTVPSPTAGYVYVPPSIADRMSFDWWTGGMFGDGQFFASDAGEGQQKQKDSGAAAGKPTLRGAQEAWAGGKAKAQADADSSADAASAATSPRSSRRRTAVAAADRIA